MHASWEKLGSFYLGRRFDLEAGEATADKVLYDAKDLTTHAVCVGMTGSGKTGLCVSLIEEAALDGVPVLAIDPKGDLGNLLLTFPELRAEDFRPWVDEGQALRKGLGVDEHAAATAKLWRDGLASWDQDGARIARLRAAAEFGIYTPGSRAGRPLAVLRSLSAPPPETMADPDARAQAVESSVASLLALLGIVHDPVRGRETIFLSCLLEEAWGRGRSLDLAGLVRAIHEPPLQRIGVLDLETFYPSKERFDLALAVNGVLASPSFAAWMEGEPLSIPSLLYAPDGRPRVSILSIAHLGDAERMFFVTLLLGELIGWMRTQPGTPSLRALLYMDEVFGYLPPVANPPSKAPLLTLLKQARAFGVGVMLATQNPVDLDYKALSNAGTWLIGRLQTERDKARVLDGLQGAAAAAARGLDRAQLDRALSGLGSRVFLLNNVHDDDPLLMHTRWAMSYLRGPLTAAQIARLAHDHAAPSSDNAVPSPTPTPTAPATRIPVSSIVPPSPDLARPVLPDEIEELFLAVSSPMPPRATLRYEARLIGEASLHYVDKRAGIDVWREETLLAALDGEVAIDPWEDADPLEPSTLTLLSEPEASASFAEVPDAARRKTSYRTWTRLLKDHLYRSRPLALLAAPELKLVSRPGETEGAFRGRLAHAARERRDVEVEKLRARFATRVERFQSKIRTAEERLERERAQYGQKKVQAAISVAAGVFGALFGSRSVGRATTAARGIGRASRERDDVARAASNVEELRDELRALEEEARTAIEDAHLSFAPDSVTVEPRPLPPRKSDITVQRVVLCWRPFSVDEAGTSRPLA